MEITPKRVIIPILYAILIWVVAFFVIGWTQISEDPAIQALYLPMVLLFSLGTLILTGGFLWWYLPHLAIDIQQQWLQESLFFGIIVMVIQFLFDIVTFGFFLPNVDLLAYFFGMFTGDPQGSTVIIMYPLIVVWTILGGFITLKQRI